MEPLVFIVAPPTEIELLNVLFPSTVSTPVLWTKLLSYATPFNSKLPVFTLTPLTSIRA